MRLLVILAVAAFEFTNAQKTKKSSKSQKRSRKTNSDSDLFEFMEKYKTHNNFIDLSEGPGLDPIRWIQEVEKKFDKDPGDFEKPAEDVNMIWGRSFGGGGLIGCDNPKFEADDEFLIKNEVIMKSENGGNCDFLKNGEKCDFVCGDGTKKSARFGGVQVPANGVTQFVCLCMGPYCGFGISNIEERDFWERDVNQRVIGCGGKVEKPTTALPETTTTTPTTTTITTTQATTESTSTATPTTTSTTITTKSTTTFAKPTTTITTLKPLELHEILLSKLNISTSNFRTLGFNHELYDGASEHFKSLSTSDKYDYLVQSDTTIQTILSNIKKIENIQLEKDLRKHLKHYLRYNHLIHLFKLIDFLSFQKVSTEEMMPSRFLNYGCWCFFHFEPEFEKYKFMEPHRGFGAAKDDLDNACRRYENCVQCAKLDHGNGCHADRAYEFRAETKNGENIFECTNSLDGGDDEVCRRNLCECDKQLAKDLSIEGDNFRVEHSTQFGGDFNRYTCYLTTRTKLDPADSCCGSGVLRTPFNSNRAECCDNGFVKGLGFGGCDGRIDRL